ncbi:MAG: ATP-binding cassette domain-containing protein [Gemmatimonadota bacterium]
MSAVVVQDITKRFGAFTAVDGLSFTVNSGEIFGLLGPNGAGKSTLLRMLTTLMLPSSGTALVGGFDIVTEADQVRRSIGVIPQAMTSDLELSPMENLLFFAKLYGVPSEKRKRQAADLLEEVELTAWAHKPVKQLSGGMRRRVEIARGLMHEPKIFFLDEPTTGLDPVSRAAVWTMLKRLKGERDLTILLTTHYMDEADKLCDRVAIVDHGVLRALDAPMTLKAAIGGATTLEVAFHAPPPGWRARLADLPGIEAVSGEGPTYRLTSRGGPGSTAAVIALSAEAGVPMESLSVQTTSLDDVFMHFSGRQLRDALQAPSPADRTIMLRQR